MISKNSNKSRPKYMKTSCCSSIWFLFKKYRERDFPDGPVVKNPSYNAGDMSLIPGQGTKTPHAVDN